MGAEDNKKLNQTHQQQPDNKARKRRIPGWQVWAIVILLAVVFGSIGAIVFNNFSMWSDRKFADRLDKAIEGATDWVHDNEMEILKTKNVALLRMLRECDRLNPSGNLGVICDKFMAAPAHPACWKGLIDPNFSVNKWELNQAIKNECIDNKWILYAIAPDKADITPEQMELLLPDKWERRLMTHQLWALIHLRKTKPDVNNEELIKHLCDRIIHQLPFNIAMVDLYIQKITFVIYAGYPEKINCRWVERVISNQRSDGGWNDRWFCFESMHHNKRPVFSIKQPPSIQHPTIQALWLLYQIKYRYPEYFGMDKQN